MGNFKKNIKKHLLTILTVLSVVSAIGLGIMLRLHHGSYSERTVMYINFPGDIFLRMIRALVLPLIVSSLIAAIAPLDVSLSKKIGLRAIAYIVLTTVISVILGIFLVVTIKPGKGGPDDDSFIIVHKSGMIIDTLLDLIR
jgi:Na+/H+-dicarboxylate symporter